MDNGHSANACDLLLRNRLAQTRIDALPTDLRPSTRADGYAIQAHLERYSQQPLYGWKIAATSAAGQAHIGVDGPLAGRILGEHVIKDGGHYRLGNNLMRVAELEFAFRMAGAIAPRHTPYGRAEVLERVATVHPAIELPDSRFYDFARVGAPQLIADAACANQFVLGPATLADWRGIDLATHTVLGFLNDVRVCEGTGANVLGDPRDALVWLVNELSGQGITIAAGQVMTTGTCVVPIVVEIGDRVVGDFGSIGRVSVSLD